MNYRQRFYEIYKQLWLRRNVSDSELKKAIMENYQNDKDFQFQNGMYVCYNEFINNEFQNEEVIKFILNDDELYEIYLKEKDNKKEILVDEIIDGSDCEYYDNICDYLQNNGLEWDDEFNITEINDMAYTKLSYSLREFLENLTIEELKYIIGDEDEEEEE